MKDNNYNTIEIIEILVYLSNDIKEYERRKRRPIPIRKEHIFNNIDEKEKSLEKIKIKI